MCEKALIEMPVHMKRFFDTKEQRWVERTVRNGQVIRVASGFDLPNGRFFTNGPFAYSFEEARAKIKDMLREDEYYVITPKQTESIFFETERFQRAFSKARSRIKKILIRVGLQPNPAHRYVSEEELDGVVAQARVILVAPRGEIWKDNWD